jgi:predicted 2-oxoglutarate/Fe(II)-dependent dioxygenase YbiX
VPAFYGRSATNPRYAFDTLAGRYVVIGLPGPMSEPGAAEVYGAAMAASAGQLDGTRAFGVILGSDAEDERSGRLAEAPGTRVLWDDDSSAHRALRAIAPDGSRRRGWMLLDPMLRVLAVWPLDQGTEAMAALRRLPPPQAHAGVELTAPVLVLPRVFEPAFCRHLIGLYDRIGGTESGFMRDVGGRTLGIMDAAHKRRRDVMVEEEGLKSEIRARLNARLVPEIRKAFQFRATRLERYLVACYDATDRGFFRAHRDNTTKATAHRRFACTINLNTGEYEGGDLRFPEFGSRSYRAPVGGAVIFSCSLLHEALPVTSGRRYAFLPFLYDEAGAREREDGARFLGEGEETAPGAVETAPAQ